MQLATTRRLDCIIKNRETLERSERFAPQSPVASRQDLIACRDLFLYRLDDAIILQRVLRKTPAASASSSQAFLVRFRARHEKLALHAAPPLPTKTMFLWGPLHCSGLPYDSMLSPSRLASIDGRFPAKSSTATEADFFEDKAADRRRAGARQGRQRSHRENAPGCGTL